MAKHLSKSGFKAMLGRHELAPALTSDHDSHARNSNGTVLLLERHCVSQAPRALNCARERCCSGSGFLHISQRASETGTDSCLTPAMAQQAMEGMCSHVRDPEEVVQGLTVVKANIEGSFGELSVFGEARDLVKEKIATVEHELISHETQPEDSQLRVRSLVNQFDEAMSAKQTNTYEANFGIEKGRQSWIELDAADEVTCGIASVSHAVPTPPLDPQPSQLDVSYLRFELPVNATVMIGGVHLLDSDHTVLANDQVMHHGGSLCARMSQTVMQASCSFDRSYDQGAHRACKFEGQFGMCQEPASHGSRLDQRVILTCADICSFEWGETPRAATGSHDLPAS